MAACRKNDTKEESRTKKFTPGRMQKYKNDTIGFSLSLAQTFNSKDVGPLIDCIRPALEGIKVVPAGKKQVKCSCSFEFKLY